MIKRIPAPTMRTATKSGHGLLITLCTLVYNAKHAATIIMLEKIFMAIRSALVAHQIIARHSLENTSPPLPYIHPTQRIMVERLNKEQSGVFVHWGAYGSGKTTAALHAGLQLQAERRTVVHLQGYDWTVTRDLHTWLKQRIGVPDDALSLSEFFSRPTTIIIDHFDLLMWRKRKGTENNDDDDDNFATVRALVEESERTKKFNALLVTTSWELAAQLKENGCKLLFGPAWRWSRDELTELFTALPESVKSVYSDQQREEMIRVSALSGTPDFMDIIRAGSASSPRLDERRAALLDREWRMGSQALADEGAAECSGRFPDKNGIYHWEDVHQQQPQKPPSE